MSLEELSLDGLLAGQVALVTGGARGIGAAVALRLAGSGADVCVADLNGQGAATTAARIRELGRRSAWAGGDISQAAVRESLVATCEGELGPIDVLVNSAGVQQMIDLFDLVEADWDRMLSINLKATFFLSQLVFKGMMERRRGAIVNLASAAGKSNNCPECIHYNVSKAGIISVTKTMAGLGARAGVRVNCVCPGMIDTDMWDLLDRDLGQKIMGLAENELRRQHLGTVPLGRMGSPDEVARVVLFLASPLSSYMTGQAINITGGWITY